MTKFHRFTAPSYYSAPTLAAAPAVATFDSIQYDFFNVVSAGTGAGGSAFADGYKAAGPNTGSYLVAFGEDASSSNANRGLRALGENTDHLDDLVHRDLAIPVRTVAVTPGIAVPSIALPPGTYVGHTLTYPLELLFDLVDDQDREIFNPATGAKIKVASISDAVIGDGFSAGVVTLTLSEPIPIAQTYRLYYAARTNVANLPVDAFTFIKVRGAQEVNAEVEATFAHLQAPLSVGQPWNAVPYTTLYDAAFSGLNERYKRSATKDVALPAYHPGSIAMNTPGSGSWFEKTNVGPGLTGYSSVTGALLSGPVGLAEHALGATWAAVLTDAITYPGGTTSNRASASSGFVFLGGFRTGNTEVTRSTPGIFSFYSGVRGDGNQVGAGYTFLPAGAVTVSGANLSLSGSAKFFTIEGTPKSTFALGIDILRINVAGVIHTVTITALTSATVGVMRYLDGSVPTFGPGAGTLVEWIQTHTFQSDGGVRWWEHALNAEADSGVDYRGYVFATRPRYGLSATFADETARFFAGDDAAATTRVALAWGGYRQTGSVFKYVAHSYLYGDGGASLAGAFATASSVTAASLLITTAGATVTGGMNTDTLIATGVSNFADKATFLGINPSEFKVGFLVSGGVVELDVPYHGTAGQLYTSLTTASTAPTLNVETATQFIRWTLDAANPTSNTATMILNGLVNGSFNSGRVTVAVRRTTASRINKVAFTCTGATSHLELTDASLSPITSGGTYWWDVYEGTIVGGDVFWKVSRYRA